MLMLFGNHVSLVLRISMLSSIEGNYGKAMGQKIKMNRFNSVLEVVIGTLRHYLN